MKILMHLILTIQELIDTLWNVNTGTMRSESRRTVELIDTLWNVNYITNSMRNR